MWSYSHFVLSFPLLKNVQIVFNGALWWLRSSEGIWWLEVSNAPLLKLVATAETHQCSWLAVIRCQFWRGHKTPSKTTSTSHKLDGRPVCFMLWEFHQQKNKNRTRRKWPGSPLRQKFKVMEVYKLPSSQLTAWWANHLNHDYSSSITVTAYTHM